MISGGIIDVVDVGKFLGDVRKKAQRANLDTATATAFYLRRGISFKVEESGQGKLTGVRVTKATEKRPYAIIRDQGWSRTNLAHRMTIQGGGTGMVAGPFYLIPAKKDFREDTKAEHSKVEFVKRYGFVSRMESGKVGFFMRKGGKAKTGRDAIALINTLRSTAYIDRIVNSKLSEADQILAANYSRYFRKYLGSN